MTHLTDMEELLSTIPTTAIRDYMREAMSCYNAKAYRGCVVLCYIALFDDLYSKLEQLGKVNSDAKDIYNGAFKRRSEQEVYESFLIDQLAAKKLLPTLDCDFLSTLKNLRNKSAHPSGHKPSAEEARFIYFETVTRVLARPILSTTHLVDDIIQRLANKNFFPTPMLGDMKEVISEELSNLHEEAIPQLVNKLVISRVSSDETTATNSNYFLIALSGLDKDTANKALQSRLLSAKADDLAYATSTIEVLSANAKLLAGLSITTINRLRANVLRQIEGLKGGSNENHLEHPVFFFKSIGKHLAEDKMDEIFSNELSALFKKRPYSSVLIKTFAKKPKIFSRYFETLLAKAGASEFSTANSFAQAIGTLDADLAPTISDNDAFKLLIEVMRAADWNAYGSKALVQSKFSVIPTIRAKALNYVCGEAVAAKAYAEDKLSTFASLEELKNHMTEETSVE